MCMHALYMKIVKPSMMEGPHTYVQVLFAPSTMTEYLICTIEMEDKEVGQPSKWVWHGINICKN